MNKKVTILGGGPGGYTAAFAAADAGLDVTLVEREHLGGTCLNRGCIPTKTLRTTADVFALTQRLSSFGIECDAPAKVRMQAVCERKNSVINILRSGLQKSCAAHKVQLVTGEARIVNAHTTCVTQADGTHTEIAGDAIIIATGSSVLDIPSLATDHTRVLNSDDMLDLQAVPKRLIVVGGGVVGCEMACIYSTLGAQVTLIEGMQRLLPLPSVDEAISSLLQREMKKQRITCLLGRTLTDLHVTQDGVTGMVAASPFVAASDTPEAMPIEADMVLVSIGRQPNTRNMGLAEAGVATDAKGWIIADKQMRTSVPHIYAIGDVLGPAKVMLAHVAAAEALCAVEGLLGRGSDMDYSVIPAAIFTSPEIGCVGLSEQEALSQQLDITTATLQMRELGKAQAMNELAGIIKLIAAKGSGKLLGAHMAGAHSTDMIAEIALALQMGATVHDVAGTIHAHPTLAEGVYETALRLKS